jgi:rare lipoprotein A (peptidoglycan hydrolase)
MLRSGGRVPARSAAIEPMAGANMIWGGSVILNRLRIGAIAGAMIAMLALAGCASQNIAPPPAPYSAPPAAFSGRAYSPHTEIASWYGPGFQGRTTSTGERFNENAMTAASKTLPLGSHVRVTNPNNGRSVVVRINDRGPYVHGRSIDLSKAAAERLGIKEQGVAPVEVASLGSMPRMMLAPETRPPPQPRHDEHHYRFPAWRQQRTAPIRRETHEIRRVGWHSRRRYAQQRKRKVWNPVGAWIAGAFSGL